MSQSGEEQEVFGTLPDGQPVYRVRITKGDMSANIITWGAVVQDLRMAGHDTPLVLGFEEFDHYPTHSPYFGAIPGRFANRIANGRFSIGSNEFQTDRNFLEKHTLHGGSQGTGKRNWQIAGQGTSHVILALHDPDGTMGFPGNCDHTCTYTLKDDGVLQVATSSVTDAPTIASLAHHSYFTLDDSGDCRDTVLTIHADNYLPVDEELIPTGEIAPVADTHFDFRSAKPIGRDLTGDLIYDHNFCISNERHGLRDVAHAWSPKSGVEMHVTSTEPGLQFYAGHKVDTPVLGLTGQPYGAYAGFCLEAQVWPDAPNHLEFPDSILRPEETLRQVTEYRFSRP